MSEKSEVAGRLLALAAGRWRGEEEILADPSSPEPLTFSGEFENESTLGGTGLISHYVQTREAETSLRCETVYRLGDDGSAVMTWTPSRGEPQIFRGTYTAKTIDVSRTDEDGMLQTLVAEYGEDGAMTNTMRITPPGAEPMTVFTGRYRRQPPVAGRQAWRDLTVEDASALRPFYERVLGWTASPVDMGGYDDYNMLDAAGEVAAGVCHARGGNAAIPPVWMIYFSVDSLADAIAAAGANGGRAVTDTMGFGNFSYAVLEDPAGAQFIACEQKV